MMSLSAAILVATCTATFGLHSSSSTTISYSYFDFGSALRKRTARSAELRPPNPFTETPPVSGPMKPTFTLSFASAAPAATPRTSAAISAIFGVVLINPPLPSIEFGRLLVGAIVARQAHHGKGCPGSGSCVSGATRLAATFDRSAFSPVTTEGRASSDIGCHEVLTGKDRRRGFSNYSKMSTWGNEGSTCRKAV